MIKCFNCKGYFDRKELINYKNNNYCDKCYRDKKDRDAFSECVCRIFKLKKPGPRIWNEHKILIGKGYTDRTIVKTLEYLYEVKKYKWVSESIYRVNEDSILEMKMYYEAEERKKRINEEKILSSIMNQKVNRYILPPEMEKDMVDKEPNWEEILNEEEW